VLIIVDVVAAATPGPSSAAPGFTSFSADKGDADDGGGCEQGDANGTDDDDNVAVGCRSRRGTKANIRGEGSSAAAAGTLSSLPLTPPVPLLLLPLFLLWLAFRAAPSATDLALPPAELPSPVTGDNGEEEQEEAGRT
jgi:hypothetical protein